MESRVAMASAVVVLASVMATTALAQNTAVSPAAPGTITTAPAPRVGASVGTPGGPAVVTGNVGSMATTTLPRGGQGLLLNNGNGTSMLISPNGSSETVATPK